MADHEGRQVAIFVWFCESCGTTGFIERANTDLNTGNDVQTANLLALDRAKEEHIVSESGMMHHCLYREMDINQGFENG